MATTSIIPLHAGRDEKISKALKRIIDYVENPDKTNSGDLVTGYECDPHTAAGEFAFDKRVYIRRTGRTRGTDDIIAYHVRQAFLHGEITPEAANQMGVELAKHFTNENHSFIVATHTDRHHIHNHTMD